MASRPRPAFDPRRILEVLAEHGADVVLVGGVAARLWGSPLLTQDLDLVPAEETENLAALAAALNELAPLEIVPARRALTRTRVSASDLRARIRSYVTPHGRVDVISELPGGARFDRLRSGASVFELGEGLHVVAASLDDVIASKEASGRPKDLADLVRLRLLRDELRAGEGGPEPA